ncbi:hypothetical protein NDG35_003655 [Salmonella enterica]|nr:hypothetical protein [Salmonella enterica]
MSLREQVAMATSMTTLIELLKNLPGYGRVSYVVTAKGDEVKTAFDIVDAAALLVSNTLDGKINPEYPQELQPRDRTRASSLLQVNQISKDLRPAQLTDSGLSSHGAPIIGEDNAVESGNGRTMGIIKAYQDGSADKYRDYLIEHAADYGLSAEKVSLMAAPVLVRRRLTKVDRVQFAKDSNISDLQEMAASEKAFVDADSITPGMMALFNPSESGDLLSRSNDAFIRGFMTQVGATQAAGLVTEDGRPTRQLVDRVQNAIFAKAYKDARLVRMVAEEPDPDMRNVLTALNAAASDFVQMQAISGEAHKQAVNTLVEGIETVDSLDKKALSALKDAVDLVRQAKESGQHISDVIAQGDMFHETEPEVKALALFIVANNRSAKRMATAFKLMAQRINEELQYRGQALGDMFGGAEVSLQDILRQVSDHLESEGMQGITGGLFEAVGAEGQYPNIGPYIGMLLRSADNVNDLINVVKLVSKTEPDDNNDIISLALYLNLNASQVFNWSKSLGISKNAIASLHRMAVHSTTAFQEIKAAIQNHELPPAMDWDKARTYRVKEFLDATSTTAPLSMVIDRLNRLFGDHTSFRDLTLSELKEASRAWAHERSDIQPGFLPKFDKALSRAESPLKVMKAFRAVSKAIAEKARDITGVMDTGKAFASAAGLDKPITIKDKAQGWLADFEYVLDLDVVDNDTRNLLGFYIDEISKVIDDEENLGRYLYDAIHQNNISLYASLRALQRTAENKYGENDNRALRLMDIVNSFRNGLSPSLVDKIHGNVQAAFESVLSQSPVNDEQAEAWVSGVQLDEPLMEKFSGSHEWRAPIDIKRELKSIYRLTGGKLGTLKRIVHEDGVRAYANARGDIVLDGSSDDLHVLWHEVGHHLEYSNPALLEKARSFLKSKSLSSSVSYGNLGSRRKPEYYIRTSLSRKYASKIYMSNKVNPSGRMSSEKPSLMKCKSTEVFSMALQLYRDKEMAARSIINNDGLLELALGCAKELHDGNH